MDAAIAREPAIIVVEEGGSLDAAEVMRRSHCAVVLDVDITTTSAWSLRRESLSSRPDDFLAAIRSVVCSQRSDTADPSPNGIARPNPTAGFARSSFRARLSRMGDRRDITAAPAIPAAAPSTR